MGQAGFKLTGSEDGNFIFGLEVMEAHQSDSRDVEAQIHDDASTGNHRTKITIYSLS